MKLWQRMLGVKPQQETRHSINNVNDWIASFNGFQYPLGVQQTLRGDVEPPAATYEQYAQLLFAANPVVWGAIQVRKSVFSQGRFRWRDVRTGALFGNVDLRKLEKPWPSARTSAMLKRLIVHADIAGNGYALDLGDRVSMMRPDYVSIVLGSRLSPDDPYLAEDAELVGYLYVPKGDTGSARFYTPDQVAHFAPMPDPLANFRGMSPLTPIVREIQGDKAMLSHKLKFLEQGATPNMIIRFDASQTIEQVKAFKSLMENQAAGVDNAYKTLYLGGGADATLVGSNFQQLDFTKTIGKAETRILMALGVHPVIAGSSEGMQGSSLNAGNYSQIRRLFSDVHLQDLWNDAAAALENLVTVPENGELIVDSRHIPFLQDDALDQANIDFTQMRAITMGTREGYEPDTVAEAVTTHDMTKLKHTGLLSVQLQPPGTGTDAGGNGNGSGASGTAAP